MTVDVGIAVSRKMFDGGDHAFVTRARDVRGHQSCDAIGIFAVR
jgi:hypothetical protein